MRSTRTLLFSDIEGSTALLTRAAEGYASLLERHRELIRGAIADHGGLDHGSEGDSVFASFPTTSEGVRAACAMQNAIEHESWPVGLDVRVRIGLHVGEVEQHGDALVGLAVHHAARVAAAANGGQIVVTDEVRRLAGPIGDSIDILSCGRFRLRDLGEVELHLVADHRVVQDDRPLRANQVRRTNLPLDVVEPIGRSVDVRTVIDLVGGHRLTTIVGPGGIGKTTLATAVGRSMLERSDRDVWLVDLGAVREPGAVEATVASAVGVPTQAGISVESMIIDRLADRSTVLIVDNCEHLLSEVAACLGRLLAACPTMVVLTTSQRPIGLRTERVHRLGPVSGKDAVALFLDRVKTADASFDADERSISAISSICDRLDGVPLAIELAAARARSLGADELINRLDDRFRLLRGGSSDAAERHRTLWATVDWSYQLLDDDAKKVFCRLAVFSGPFDLDAAEYVSDPGDLRQPVVDVLTELVDRSMVVHHREGMASTYRLLETMRDFGTAVLVAEGSLADLRSRHLDHVVTASAAAGRDALAVDPQRGERWFRDNWSNLRTAFSWALESDRVAAAEQLVSNSGPWSVRQLKVEHLDWCRSLEQLEERGHRLSTLALGTISYWYGNVLHDEQRANRLARLGLDRAEARSHPDTRWCWPGLPGDRHTDAVVRHHGLLAILDANPNPTLAALVIIDALDTSLAVGGDAPRKVLDRAIELAELHPSAAMRHYAELYAGHFELALSIDPIAARRHYEQALVVARETGDRLFVGQTLRALATAAVSTEPGTALPLCADAVELLYETRYWLKLHQALDSTLLALALSGHVTEALVLLDFLDRDNPEPYGVEHQLGFRERARAAIELSSPVWPPNRRPLGRRDVAAFVGSLVDIGPR